MNGLRRVQSSSKSKRYVILGEPIPFYKTKPLTDRDHINRRKTKLTYTIQLEDQHEDTIMFHGPLHLEITFYVATAPSELKNTTYHIYRPDLLDLIRYLEFTLEGVLFLDDCIIASISSKKIYEKENPRTELIIREL